jgi:hypothetical protein
MYLVQTFLVNHSIFSIFFSVEKKIILVRGKESRGRGPRGKKRDKKKIEKKYFFNFFHHTCDSAVT